MPLPTIPSGNVASALPTGFNVDNSCRFDNGSSAYVYRNQGTPTGNGKKATISVWMKPGIISSLTAAGTNGFFEIRNAAISASFDLYIDGGRLQFGILNASGWVGSLIPNMTFRDHSAWYHIVAIYDSAQSTDNQRMKIYVNGKDVRTDLGGYATETYVAQDTVSTALAATSGYTQKWGRYADTSSYNWDGYMAEAVFLDNEAASIGDLGEFDEDSPTIWKPKDVSGLTFGDEGNYLDFEDSSALGNDVSGNNNDFTSSGLAATDQSIGTPTNNFCVLNRLWAVKGGTPGAGTFSEGNLKFVGDGDHDCTFGTIGLQNGLWYWEVLLSNDAGAGIQIGVTTTQAMQEITSGDSGTCYPDFAGFREEVRLINWNSEEVADYGSNATNDIYGLLLDLDSGTKTLKCYHNDTLKGTIDLPTDKGDTWIPYIGDSGSADAEMEMNFGSPPYTVSSGNADGNGYGNFEFATKSGYAICTKNLAEFG